MFEGPLWNTRLRVSANRAVLARGVGEGVVPTVVRTVVLMFAFGFVVALGLVAFCAAFVSVAVWWDFVVYCFEVC